ncbi:MAG: DISARM system phospholipase D-like protein DrmC [Actinobacteria bacterium]|nr:DISARM system phospholipase D-like protein DrmC [Actinomycetota bacterium]
MPSDPHVDLGSFLTATEAGRLAAQFEAGTPASIAVREVAMGRREAVRGLLAAANFGPADRDRTVSVLRAIAGAKTVLRELTPVWTMPGHEANAGHLTSEFHRIVSGARTAVTCATYNFEPTSAMWRTLKAASETAGVAVTVYFDDKVGDAARVKAHLPRAQLLQPATLPSGRNFKSHAKFVVIDHRLVLLTSANFSRSAEQYNVELGLLVDDTGLAESIEKTMASKHNTLYERL